MYRFTRTVLGYHGCEPGLADSLISGHIPISRWRSSRNDFDWLGEGIYFWAHAPGRALEWIRGSSVVGAVIQLADCLDLTDTTYTDALAGVYENIKAIYLRTGNVADLPTNRGKRHDLDCLVIRETVERGRMVGLNFQAVRSPFLDGKPAFPGSRILRESHIQIAVVHPACIVGVFRPDIPGPEAGP